MDRLAFVVWLILSAGTTYAQAPNTIDSENALASSRRSENAGGRTPKKSVQPKLNQVFVKVIVPVTSRTPKQDGPAVEFWVAEQLKKLGDFEYFAVTDWVPVCDGLLADSDVWDGRLNGKHPYCPVGGDIPERENGRLLVSVTGWSPSGGYEARITLSDEVGNRAVAPVQILVGEEKKPVKVKADERLPCVAVLICPPPETPAVIDHKK